MKQDIFEKFRSAIHAGQSREEVIADMKRNGLKIIEAIKATRELFGVSLADAKLLVAQHPDWAGVTTASAPFQEALIQSFEDAANKNLDDR